MPIAIHSILLVADNPARSLARAVLLGEAGYRVDCLPDGVDPVEYTLLWHPNALVVDLADRARAADFCAQFRANPRTSALPILIVAAESSGDEPAWIGEGIASWIVDRYGSEALEDALAHALQRPVRSLPSARAGSDELESLVAEAIAANARLLVIAARRVATSGATGATRSSLTAARLLVAVARSARRREPPDRLGGIPTVRALIAAYVADASSPGQAPGTLVGELQAVRLEAGRFVARLAGRFDLPEGRAIPLLLDVNQYFDAMIRLTVDEYWRDRAGDCLSNPAML